MDIEREEMEEIIVSGGIDRRTFMKLAAASGLTVGMGIGGGCGRRSSKVVKIVITGGGAAGLSMAARLRRRVGNAKIVLIDPAERQFYQPGFTLIGGGVYKANQVWRPQSRCIPRGVEWVQQAVTAVDPTAQQVVVADGTRYEYDFLLVTPGIQCNWEQIEGITQGTLGVGNAHSIYDFEGAQKTWVAIQEFVERGGRGVYADTYTKHKCGGAPKKICLLTEHLARKRKRRDGVVLDFFTASGQLYDVPYFTPRLLDIYKERNVSITIRTRIKGVDTAAKQVHFIKSEKVKQEVSGGADGGMRVVEKSVTSEYKEDYDFLHLTPPQSAPDFVREAGLGWTEGDLAAEAWTMVDKDTLVHKLYPNIISLGDVAGVPTSKTSAAVRKQVPVAVENMVALIEGDAPTAIYDGYAACPIVTNYGHVLMAEFNYQKERQSSFPLSMMDMSRESRIAWFLKVRALKPLYFYGMIPGWW